MNRAIPADEIALEATRAPLLSHLLELRTRLIWAIITFLACFLACFFFAKDIYGQAIDHVEELCAPYASVIDIDRAKLPTAEAVQGWTSEQFVRALRHVPSDPQFNASTGLSGFMAERQADQAQSRTSGRSCPCSLT